VQGINSKTPHSAARRAPVFLLSAVAAWVAVGLAGCERAAYAQGKAKQPEAPAAPARAVKAAPVALHPMERIVNAVATLAAQDQATLSVKVPGVIQAITVDFGSAVKAGQVIARVDPRDYELKFKQAEAALAQARARLGLPLEGGDDRVQLEETSLVKQNRAGLEEAKKARDRADSLFKAKILPQQDMETAMANYEIAATRLQDAIEEVRTRMAALQQRRVEVEIARQQLADASITASFDGIVKERRASVGEFLNTGAPVATIVRTDPLRLRIEVPEREASRVRAGQSVRLTVDGDTNHYTGTLKRLSPSINEQSRMLVAEADVPNTSAALRPGAFARVEVVVEEKAPAVTIPRTALVVFAGIEKVFLVKDGKAVEKNITTGRRNGDFIEVPAGLKPGDLVVLDPGNLQSGAAVTIGKE
jgi:RND family efflux transporter MFP subunit